MSIEGIILGDCSVKKVGKLFCKRCIGPISYTPSRDAKGRFRSKSTAIFSDWVFVGSRMGFKQRRRKGKAALIVTV